MKNTHLFLLLLILFSAYSGIKATPAVSLPDDLMKNYETDTIIVDNSDTDNTSSTAGWERGDGSCINGEHWVIPNDGDVFTWSPDITDEGAYEVLVWYSPDWGALYSTVPYVVNHNFGSDTTIVDQTQNGGQWVSLGMYNLAAGNNVQLLGTPDGRGCADAVAFIKVPAMEGDYTVGVEGDFTTINQAFADIQVRGITGPVNLILTDETYDLGRMYGDQDAIEINNIPGTSETNTVTLKPDASQDSVVISAYTRDSENNHNNGAFFALNGVNNLIIDGSNNGTDSRNLSFILSKETWYGNLYAVRIDSATNITIKNTCMHDESNIHPDYNTSYHHRSFMKVENGKKIYIDNNRVINSFDGIVVSGANGQRPDSIYITNNYLGNPDDSQKSIKNKAISVNNADHVMIKGNKLVNISTVIGNTWQEETIGMFIGKCYRVDVLNNIIDGVISDRDKHQLYQPQGIRVDNDTTGLMTIANNVIKGVRRPMPDTTKWGKIYPVSMVLANRNGPTQIYHNTIYMGDTTLTYLTKSETSAKEHIGLKLGSLSANGSRDIRNNIFVTTGLDEDDAAPDNFYAIYIDGGWDYRLANDTLDYNVYFIDTDNPNAYMGYAKGVEAQKFQTLTDWKAVSWSSNLPVDDNSYFEMPPFRMNNYNIHPDSSFVGINAGIELSIEMDIDGQERDATPDIGADEVLPLPTKPVVTTDSVLIEGFIAVWDSINALTYQIQVSEGDNDFSTTQIDELTVDTSYQASELTASTDYYYRLRGINLSGNGDWSDTLMLTTITPAESIESSAEGDVNRLAVGSSVQMNAEVLPAEATYNSIEWAVENISGDASITEGGELTGNSQGLVKVIAAAIDGSGVTDTTEITVFIPMTDLQIIPEDNDTVNIGSTITLTADISPENAQGLVDWNVTSEGGAADYDAGADLTTCDVTGEDPGLIKLSATATDGTELTDTIEIMVVDIENPQLSTTDFTVELDADGNATITPDDVVVDASDNYGLADTLLSKTTFDCNDIGTVDIDVTVSDIVDSTTTQKVTITVLDRISPQMTTTSPTLQLDSEGNASLTVDDVIETVSDNCGVNDTTITGKTNYTCDDVGQDFYVNVNITDASGNAISLPVKVMVEDAIPPSLTTKDIEVPLSGTGNASINPDDVIESASDNCSIENYSVDPADFTSDDVGNVTVTVTVTDPSGNSTSEEATVTVSDDTGMKAVSISNIDIYPNPVRHQLSIDFNSVKAERLELVNLQGQIVKSVKVISNKQEIDLSTIQHGIYILKIHTKNKVLNHKLIKQ